MTTLAEALTGVTRLGLDTAPIIYFVEEHPRYYLRVSRAFQAVAGGRIVGITSMLTVAEVLVQPLRHPTPNDSRFVVRRRKSIAILDGSPSPELCFSSSGEGARG